MNKKVISSVLAGAIALSTMGVSAFAAGDKQIKSAGATTYKVSATLAAPEINVTLPGTVAAVVNPYGVSFEMKGQTYGAQGVTSGLYTIKNNTTASAVSVVATATLTVPTKADANDKTIKIPTIKVLDDGDAIETNETAKTKAIFAYVAGAASTTNIEEGAAVVDLVLFDGMTDAEGTALTKETSVVEVPFVDATLSTKEAPITGTPTTLMVIPKATKAVAAQPAVPESSEGAGDGKPAVAAQKATFGYGQFQLGGDVTDTKITPWTSADKIAINLVLDIGPAADPQP